MNITLLAEKDVHIGTVDGVDNVIVGYDERDRPATVTPVNGNNFHYRDEISNLRPFVGVEVPEITRTFGTDQYHVEGLGGFTITEEQVQNAITVAIPALAVFRHNKLNPPEPALKYDLLALLSAASEGFSGNANRIREAIQDGRIEFK